MQGENERGSRVDKYVKVNSYKGSLSAQDN